MSLRVSLRLVVSLLAFGCQAPKTSPEAEDLPPLIWSGEGAGPLVVDALSGLRAAAFAEDGLVVVQRDLEPPVSLQIGAAPSQVAIHQGELLVSLRAGRALARLRFDGERLVEVDRAPVGAEPVGLAVRADGERVYVAHSTAQQVWELDGDLGLLRIFEVGGNPEGLALHPSGETLYVSAVVGGLSTLDLALDAPIAVPVPLPEVFDFPKRVTGPAAVSPDGSSLAVPALWQDVMRPSNHSDEEAMARDPAEKYAEIGLGLTPNNPGVVVFSVDGRVEAEGGGNVGEGAVGLLGEQGVGQLQGLAGLHLADEVAVDGEDVEVAVVVVVEEHRAPDHVGVALGHHLLHPGDRGAVVEAAGAIVDHQVAGVGIAQEEVEVAVAVDVAGRAAHAADDGRAAAAVDAGGEAAAGLV